MTNLYLPPVSRRFIQLPLSQLQKIREDILGQNALNTEKSSLKGQGDEDSDAVSFLEPNKRSIWMLMLDASGLDNAGKTTIVKQIMNEDVTTVSPTLGFIIKTIDFEG